MAAPNSFVQVALDSTGKRVEMTQRRSVDVDTSGVPIDVYTQRAEMVGVTQDALDQLLAINKQQLSVLQALLALMNATCNAQFTAEDYPPDLP